MSRNYDNHTEGRHNRRSKSRERSRSPPRTPRTPRTPSSSRERENNQYHTEILIRVPNNKLRDVEGFRDDYFYGYESIENAVRGKFGARITMGTTSMNDGRSTMISIRSRKALRHGVFDMIQSMIQDRCGHRSRTRPRRVYKEREDDKRVSKEVEIDEKCIPFVIGSKRCNIKRISQMFSEERGVYIQCPKRDEKPIFKIFAEKEETVDLIIEELYKSQDMVKARTSEEEDKEDK